MFLKPRVFPAAVAAVMVIQGVCWAGFQNSAVDMMEAKKEVAEQNVQSFKSVADAVLAKKEFAEAFIAPVSQATAEQGSLAEYVNKELERVSRNTHWGLGGKVVDDLVAFYDVHSLGYISPPKVEIEVTESGVKIADMSWRPAISIGKAYYTTNIPSIDSFRPQTTYNQLKPYINDPDVTVTVTNSGFRCAYSNGDSTFIVDRDVAGTIGSKTYNELKPFLDDPEWTVTIDKGGYRCVSSDGKTTFVLDRNMFGQNKHFIAIF